MSKSATQSKRARAKLALVACALVALGGACSSSQVEAYSAGPHLDVTPAGETPLYFRQNLLFHAAVVGAAASPPVQWSIGGPALGSTIGADGMFTAGSTTGTVTIVASISTPSLSGSATVRIVEPPPGGPPMTTAHRTSGVAPLGVFFDAVSTVSSGYAEPFTWDSGVVQPSDMEGSQFSWDFGDPASGTFSTTGKSKNTATGYTAAHIYEQPGTYSATLQLLDTDGVQRTYSQTITVLDPDVAFAGRTYYVAASGSDSNAGTSEAAPFLTIGRALQVVDATSKPGARILFRRGDTFTATGAYTVRAAGPGLIGAYGTGARPIILAARANNHTFTFSDGGAGWPYATDWRVMDLDMVGPVGGTDNAFGPAGPHAQRPTRDFLLFRVVSRNDGTPGQAGTRWWSTGIMWQTWELYAYEHSNAGMFVAECEVTGSNVIGAYVGGRWLAFLGNDVHEVGNHSLRVWQGHHAVVSNNRLWGQGTNRHNIKLHGPSYYGGGSGPNIVNNVGDRSHEADSSWIVLSDNVLYSRFTAASPGIWATSIGPQNSDEDEHVSHVVYERNRHVGGAVSSTLGLADVESSAAHAVFRNNLFNGTGARDYTGVFLQRRGAEPTPTDIRVYGNTIYVGSTTVNPVVGFDVTSDVQNCRIRNNVIATSGKTVQLLNRTGGTGFVEDHNLIVTNPATPLFTDAANGDFTLVTDAPAVNAGASLIELREDFARAPRGANALDIGAYESH